MEPREIAKELMAQRAVTLRKLADQIKAGRAKADPTPIINITLNIPPEAFRVIVETVPPNIIVNVPEQPVPNISVTPQIIVNVPEQPAPQIQVNVPEQLAPVVNIQPAAITVEAPQLTLAPKIEVLPATNARPTKAIIRRQDGTEDTVELV